MHYLKHGSGRPGQPLGTWFDQRRLEWVSKPHTDDLKGLPLIIELVPAQLFLLPTYQIQGSDE
jgi:hypothetical protein